MTPERWQQLEALVQAAQGRTPTQREALLAAVDPELRREVEAILAQGSIMADPTLTLIGAGSQLGPYKIEASIGKGGMGEVFRAMDTRLGRKVAIKISSIQFDARFERETRAISALNHPNICTLYDVGALPSGAGYLVMELVEGESLAARLKRGKLSIDETLCYGAQIASALAAAHAKGITHRDLKPGNIMLAKSGVKVLDFGLAKSAQDATLTVADVALGTPAYMAPEQREGKECDARTDIYALGLVLYEMTTGQRASQDLSRLDQVPERLAHVLERCLETDPEERWQTASDVEKELRWSAEPKAVPSRSSSNGLWIWTAVAFVAALVLGAAAVLYFRPVPPPVRPVVTFAISGTTAPVSLSGSHDVALTPDGLRVVYVGNNQTQLFVRALDSREPVAIASGQGLRNPFVSPDGQWVGYGSGVFGLRKVAISGGTPIQLPKRESVLGVDGPLRGATWLPDDTIIFATANASTGLQRISASGEAASEKAEVLTHPDPADGEADHILPEILPGGRAVLFTITAQTGGVDAAQVAVLDLKTGTRKVLIRGGTDAHYVGNGSGANGKPSSSGYLVYTASGALRAVPFDSSALETRGSSIPVVFRMALITSGGGEFAVTAEGTLAYIEAPAGAGIPKSTLVWLDREGKETPIPVPPKRYAQARMSPDGFRLALTTWDAEQAIWIWDLRGAALTRFTLDPVDSNYPVWTPDSRRIVYSSMTGGALNLWSRAADGTGAAERLTTNDHFQNPTGISPDGALVVLHEKVSNRIQMFQVTLGGNHQVTPLLQTRFIDMYGTPSPDGRWFAYSSNRSGQFEIYVCPYPNVAASQWQVSTSGGQQPMWSQNSKELFFVTPSDALMRVSVEASGQTWKAGTPEKLLNLASYDIKANISLGEGRPYDISPDGRRFVMIKKIPSENAAAPQIIVVQNWIEELRRLVSQR